MRDRDVRNCGMAQVTMPFVERQGWATGAVITARDVWGSGAESMCRNPDIPMRVTEVTETYHGTACKGMAEIHWTPA